MLELEGRVDVNCTREHAWDLFCRFGDVAALIPTVKDVEIDGDRVEARVETKLGVLPVSSRISIEVTGRVPNERLEAEGLSYLGETIKQQIARGKDTRGIDAGSVGRLRMRLDLKPGESAESIVVCYHAEVEAEGRLKKIYQSILKTKAPAMMEDFAKNIRATLEGSDRTAAAPVTHVRAAPSAGGVTPLPEATASRADPRPGEAPQARPGRRRGRKRRFVWRVLKEVFGFARRALRRGR